jgi:hypothetical protein
MSMTKYVGLQVFIPAYISWLLSGENTIYGDEYNERLCSQLLPEGVDSIFIYCTEKFAYDFKNFFLARGLKIEEEEKECQ